MPDDRFPPMAYWARVTLTVAGALVVLAAAWRVRNILLLVLVAAVLAAGLDPQVQWLQRRRLSRGWAVTAIVLLSVGLLVLFAWLVIPSAVRQTQQLARHTPDYLNRLQHATGLLGTLQRKYDLAQRLRETTARLPALALKKVPGLTASAGSIIFNVLTITVLMVYFLLGLPRGKQAAKAWLAGPAGTPTATPGSWRSRSHEPAATSPATSSSRSSRGRWRSPCWKSCGCPSRPRSAFGWRSPT
jgi:predicted PurR-regulated permease PerM